MESGASTTAIEVEGLTKQYGDLLAVGHIDFQVHRAEVFGFLGPNGAGKTTTQRLLTMLPEPTAGRTMIDGRDLAREPYPLKRCMGLVPEALPTCWSGPADRLAGWTEAFGRVE